MASDQIYLGNPLLKKANVQIDFTKEQVQEFIKCKEDPVYFTKNYVKIVSLDEGLVPFKMWDFQTELIEKFHNNRFNIAKLPRQTGKSTTVVSYLLHYLIFNDNVNVLVYDLTLIIGNIVIFQQVFANIEVMPFDLALCIFNGAIDHLVLNGFTASIVELVHHVADGLRYEDAHQIIVQRQIESAGSRIALTPGSAPELVVDTTGLVARSADNV